MMDSGEPGEVSFDAQTELSNDFWIRSRVLPAMERLMSDSDKMFMRNATATTMTATVTDARKRRYRIPSAVILTVLDMESQG